MKRGIFQGNSLSPLLFVLSMVPFSLILRKVNTSYEWGKNKYKLNHLLLMDDLKLFSKNEEQMDTLVRNVYVFSADIRTEFGMKKCGILTMKREKATKEVEEEGYTYLGIAELDNIAKRMKLKKKQ